jgi:hypothetical protein
MAAMAGSGSAIPKSYFQQPERVIPRVCVRLVVFYVGYIVEKTVIPGLVHPVTSQICIICR